MVREFATRLALIAFAASLAIAAAEGGPLAEALLSATLTAAAFGLLGIGWGHLAEKLAEELAAANVRKLLRTGEEESG